MATQSKSEDEGILDLEARVHEYLKLKKRIPKKNYQSEINWERVHFTAQGNPKEVYSSRPTGTGDELVDKHEFTCDNSTASAEQEFRYTAARESRLSYTFNFTTSVTTGPDSLTIPMLTPNELRSYDLPPELLVNLQRHAATLQGSRREVSTTVKVPAQSAVTITTEMKERKLIKTFKQTIRISGKVVVRFYDEAGQLQGRGYEIPVAGLFRDEMEDFGTQTVRNNCSVYPNYVQFEVKGHCILQIAGEIVMKTTQIKYKASK